MQLYDYVKEHAQRGACVCGKCMDAPSNPERHQPSGHTADLVFFKVAVRNNPSRTEFEQLARKQFHHWFDGKEHSYLEMGADMGDQGTALMTMGLGRLLEVWDLLTPENILPFLSKEEKLQIAGKGLITIKYFKEK